MKSRRFYLILIISGIVILGWWLFHGHINEPSLSPSLLPAESQAQSVSVFAMPIDQAKTRVTKKPFGIYVTPQNSPVTPERFTGYHTGVDFETFPSEASNDVAIYAICDGPLLEKISASGYGGVAVQRCNLYNQAITVVYGHLRLSSVSAAVSQQLIKGQRLAVLGTGYSKETDGERKHLHLSIHRGAVIDIRGYVQSQHELSSWINFGEFLN